MVKGWIVSRQGCRSELKCPSANVATIFIAVLTVSAYVATTSYNFAHAAPWQTTRVGGMALVGPASKHPASMYYNPAAIGLSSGHRFVLDATVQLDQQSITGSAAENTTHTMPHFFVGAVSDLGLESITVGLAVHTPYGKNYTRDESTPARYPLHYFDSKFFLYQLFVTPAATLRIFDWLYVGAGFTYTFGLFDMHFARDAALDGGSVRRDDRSANPSSNFVALDDCAGQPCGYGSARAQELYRIKGTSNGIGFSVGMLLKLVKKLDIGIGYVSAIRGIGGGTSGSDDIAATGQSWTRRSLAAIQNANCQNTATTSCSEVQGRATVRYQLPDLLSVGINWHVTPKWSIGAQFRWLTMSRIDNIDIQLTGPQLALSPAVPNRITFFRGFQDVYSVQLELAHQLRPHLNLQTALMWESAAVPTSATNPTEVDTAKFDILAAIRWSWTQHIHLQLGYNLIAMLPADVTHSAFSGSHQVACVDANLSTDLSACQAAAAGKGIASATGAYQLLQHRLGLGFVFTIE